MQIIPMENERGREMVEDGALCERKNGRGVDTNRNWEVHWGFKEKDYDPSEEFPGEKPFRCGLTSLCGLTPENAPQWRCIQKACETCSLNFKHQQMISQL